MKQTFKSGSGLEAEVTIGTNETGNQKQMELWSSNIYWVREDIQNIKASFIKLGFHLWEFKRCEAYRIYGYDDFYEFCDKNFHLSSSTVRRHIQLYERFGEHGDNQCKMNIACKYENYSYSQLCEMLPLEDKELKNIKPEMTVKEIREYKLSRKEKNCASFLIIWISFQKKVILKMCATSHKLNRKMVYLLKLLFLMVL